MLCPTCGTDSQVSRTISVPPSTQGYERIWRRHKCFKGHNFYTIEAVTQFKPKQLIRKVRIKGVVGGSASQEVR